MADTGEGKKEEADYKRLHSFPLIRVRGMVYASANIVDMKFYLHSYQLSKLNFLPLSSCCENMHHCSPRRPAEAWVRVICLIDWSPLLCSGYSFIFFFPRGAGVKDLASQARYQQWKKRLCNLDFSVMLITIIKDCGWSSISTLSLHLVTKKLTNVFISSLKLWCLL